MTELNPELLDLRGLDAVDAFMLLAFIASIGLEISNVLSLRILIFESGLKSTWWQQTLLVILIRIVLRTNYNTFDYLRPVKEMFSLFLSLSAADSPPQTSLMLLANRSYIFPREFTIINDFGITWEKVYVDLKSVLSCATTRLQDYNIIVLNKQNATHNFVISAFSQIANDRLAVAKSTMFYNSEYKESS